MQTLKPRLTILTLTYNHGAYIQQALDGFLMQKTNFPFKIVIGDDGSTDQTLDIITSYIKKYPNKIEIFPSSHNKGSEHNFYKTYTRAATEYVATCEGDDFWTDENKLQRQVDFLDSHPDYALCFHSVSILEDGELTSKSTFPTPRMLKKRSTLLLTDLLEKNFIQTCSVVYRWRFDEPETLEALFPKGILPGDHFLHLLHAERGKIFYMPHLMGVYRKHGAGIWSHRDEDSFYILNGLKHIHFYDEIEKRFGISKHKEKISMGQKTLLALLRQRDFQKILSFAEEKQTLFDSVLSSFEKEKHKKGKHPLRIGRTILVSALIASIFILFSLLKMVG